MPHLSVPGGRGDAVDRRGFTPTVLRLRKRHNARGTAPSGNLCDVTFTVRQCHDAGATISPTGISITKKALPTGWHHRGEHSGKQKYRGRQSPLPSCFTRAGGQRSFGDPKISESEEHTP